MNFQIVNDREGQGLLRLASGLDQPGGNPWMKEIAFVISLTELVDRVNNQTFNRQCLMA